MTGLSGTLVGGLVAFFLLFFIDNLVAVAAVVAAVGAVTLTDHVRERRSGESHDST
jgi:hypothetical protein